MYSTKRVKKYFLLAKEASKNSNFPQHKLGAVIIYHGVPLAIGYNTTKTSPVQKYYNKKRKGFDVEADYENNNSIHSEMMALNKVKYLDIDFNKTAIFIYRELKNGTPALARPCAACSQRIKDLGIKDIYYSSNGGWTHEHWD